MQCPRQPVDSAARLAASQLRAPGTGSPSVDCRREGGIATAVSRYNSHGSTLKRHESTSGSGPLTPL
eukprot:scaffold1500_cov398-Prasinococcus_capsulatus_cf.AAC.8